MFSRFLICAPFSNEGQRYIDDKSPKTDSLQKFNERVRELLEMHRNAVASGEFKRKLLRFSPEAQAMWISIFNNVESQIRWGGPLHDIRDYASKYADNLARVAAIFHFLQGLEGDISVETLNQADIVCTWFLYEFKRLFSLPSPISIVPQHVIDAELLKTWLIQYFIKQGIFWVDKSHMQCRCPGSIREKQRLVPAILALVNQGILHPICPAYVHGRKPKIQYGLDRNFFVGMAAQQGFSAF